MVYKIKYRQKPTEKYLEDQLIKKDRIIYLLISIIYLLIVIIINLVINPKG